MELYVLNKKFESIDVVDTFTSLIWTDRYIGAGDFEIYLLMDKSLLNIFVEGYYLWNAESEHLMIIEQLNIKSDIEEGNHLIVTGRSVESILDRRIIWGQKVLTGSFQDAIYTLLKENVIEPEIDERRIEDFIFEESTDEKITGLTIDAQYMGENLYDTIYTLCDEASIGFKVTLNDDNKLVFKLYSGTDRSYDQMDNPFVIFSPDFENIINSSYLESKQAYKNVTLVAGEGEGADRVTTVVGSASGIERREVFTDASNLSTNIGSGKKLTNDEYLEQLNQRGSEELTNHAEVKAFEGEVEATRMFKYGIDFFIGDIVQLANEYGHEDVVRVSEYVISQNKEGISMYPTFKSITKGEE